METLALEGHQENSLITREKIKEISENLCK
jgi:hypothetical protein